MVHIDVSVANKEPQSDLLYRGVWWLAAAPQRRISGSLTFSPVDGGVLTLDGGLTDPAFRLQGGLGEALLFGEAQEGTRITILDAFYMGSRGRGSDNIDDIYEETWKMFSVVTGAHILEGEDALFDEAYLATNLLPEWADMGRPNDVGEHGQKVGVEITIPESLEGKIGNDTINLVWLESSKWGPRTYSATITPKFGYKFSQPATLDEIWKKFVTPIIFFTTFATGDPDRVVSLTVIREVDSETDFEKEHFGLKAPQILQVYSVRWSRQIERRPSHPWQFLLPLDEIKSGFSRVMQSWFSICDAVSDALLEFFSITLEPKMFLEDSFSRSVRCLEIWHRKSFGGTFMGEDEYEELLQKLRTQCSSKEWQVVSMRMRYGNEVTQKKRLDDSIKMAGLRVEGLIHGYRRVKGKKFTRAVVDMRNEMTHGSQPEGYTLADNEMVWAKTTLQVVFISNLLKQLGFSKVECEQIVARSAIWSAVSGPYNAWAMTF